MASEEVNTALNQAVTSKAHGLSAISKLVWVREHISVAV